MKLTNHLGESVYFNSVVKHNKIVWVIQGIGDTVVYGRDKQKLSSRSFAYEHQAIAYLQKHGFFHGKNS